MWYGQVSYELSFVLQFYGSVRNSTCGISASARINFFHRCINLDEMAYPFPEYTHDITGFTLLWIYRQKDENTYINLEYPHVPWLRILRTILDAIKVV
jgi:hypothetical protein